MMNIAGNKSRLLSSQPARSLALVCSISGLPVLSNGELPVTLSRPDTKFRSGTLDRILHLGQNWVNCAVASVENKPQWLSAFATSAYLFSK
jgi:hypothetical protein